MLFFVAKSLLYTNWYLTSNQKVVLVYYLFRLTINRLFAIITVWKQKNANAAMTVNMQSM